ncbi:MAG: bifunctional UDP-N-acetylglucosamine diphosphorylase/glucosamine-1-phosphate N-acetyltransferase GlmU [Acidimicrobiia bacterium]|nr:bifunctional UDP-N-acetylglucosamine diphosphorylase/glucosamine-1-phosphate N-acetyltransferase GlmU [Acidimicrobiia bacterium]
MTMAAVVLAAGKGTRMKSERAKVLHELAGRSLLEWTLAAVEPLAPDETVIVVGHEADRVRETCPEGTSAAVQEPQNGTGHAVQVGLDAMPSTPDSVLVIPADMPLIATSTLMSLIDRHRESGAVASVLTVELEDPAGYGRIVRDGERVTAIVEHRDATDEQRRISEVNTSVYVFDGQKLDDALGKITPDNDQGEYYLTDVIRVFTAEGLMVSAVATDAVEGIGINSQAQLADVAAIVRERVNRSLMESGVWMADPSRVYVDASVEVAPGAKLHPDTYLRGATTIGEGAEIGPGVDLRDTVVDREATVRNTVAVSASVGAGAIVGPFTHLRPGSEIGPSAKVGAFVEVKGSTIGEGSKIPHLSYVGDTTVGTRSNIGAGTITVNYDGYKKHRTVIGDNVRIGADTMLVAPIVVGDDAFTGAGSVITDDVPSGALAVERSAQKNVDGYADRRRRRAEGDAK